MLIKKPKFWDYEKNSLYAILLFPLSLIYSLLLKIFQNSKNQKKFQIPIICIGNIYIGGTGKTPISRKIFDIVKSLDKKPAFIKKFYKYLEDEIKMLEKTGEVFTHKKRETSIFEAINSKFDVVILDDGYQDFSIKPNFSILCFNSKQRIGNGFVIPSGPLRENLNAIKRSDCIIINGEKNFEFENKLKQNFGEKKPQIFYSQYKLKNIEKFLNKEIIAFAGIGNPSNFFDLLIKNNLNVKKTISFPDHHKYSKKDFDKINSDKSMLAVTTEKDYFRMSEVQKKNCDYLEVDLEINDVNELTKLIKSNL